MTKKDYGWLGALLFLAVFIWLRDMSWMSAAEDTLPILIALPLFFWLGQPWELLEEEVDVPVWRVTLGILLFLAGIVANWTLLMAIAWTFLLWSWVRTRVQKEHHDRLRKLSLLTIMAFPWVTLDMQLLGWYFRLSGAWVTAKFFEFTGADVLYAGTNILVDGMPISVEAACAGLNTLQSMLIAGIMLDYIILGDSNLFWANIPVLFIVSWIANTLRVAMLSAVAIWISPEFALGTFHTWGGWFVLVLMFLMCWGIFVLQASEEEDEATAT